MEIQPLRPRLFKRSPLFIVLALALGSEVSPTWALGFGRAQTTAVLGMPLDFRVGLRLDDNETLDPACIASTVLVGDSQVPQSAISVVLDGAGANASLRVSTSVPMTEPLVVVNLSAGCTVRVTRRFTLFADPPGHRVMPVVTTPPPPAEAPVAPPATSLAAVVVPPNAPLAPPAVLPLVPAAGSPPATSSAQGPAPAGDAGAAPAPAPAPPPAPAPSAPASAAPAPAGPAKAAPGAAPKVSGKGDGQAAPRTDAKPARKPEPKPRGETASAPAKTATPEGQAKASPAAAGAPRLKLEAPRISARVIDAAAAAEREAALRNAEEAAISAKAAAEAAEKRASELERSIALLQQESKANREALLRLTQAIEESRGSDGSQALLAALVALLGLSGFLLYRLRRLQIESRAGWVRVSPEGGSIEGDPPGGIGSGGRSAAAAAALSGAASAGAEGPTDDAPDAAALGDPAKQATGTSSAPASGSGGWSPTTLDAAASASAFPSLASAESQGARLGLSDPSEVDTPLDRTQLLPPSASSVSPPLRPVSIEELLDLEQQVEFYTVLGQDDAALALLVEHLRHTGGTYPLPFLKLMELYRRKGDADAYERTRDRFNQRFNAVAPAWGAPPVPQRGLDEYPEVVRQIQQAWSRPVDATAMLENMLFRTQGGELFDLSALADVLFLFTLARDLLENESGEVTSVDVLLPFDDLGSGTSDRVPMMEPPPRPSGAVPSPAAPVLRSSSPAPLASLDLPLDAGLGRSAPALGSAALSSVAAAAPVAEIDIPVGEPMLEPLFQETEERSPAASSDKSLDFDLSDFDLPVATVTPATGHASPAAVSASLDIDIDGLSLEPAPARKPDDSSGSGAS